VATVIKAGTAGKIVKRFEHLALRDHMADARAVVVAAQQRASAIVAQAERDGERIRREAHQNGYREGFEEGRAAGERVGRDQAFAEARQEFGRQQQQAASMLRGALDGFDAAKGELLERARHDVLGLAIALAERIAKRTGEVDREAAVANAREALRCVGARTDLTIRVHAADLDSMKSLAAELAEGLGDRAHVRVVEDASIDPGGCVVEAPPARVDATLAGQFREAVDLLLGERTAGAGEQDNESAGKYGVGSVERTAP